MMDRGRMADDLSRMAGGLLGVVNGAREEIEGMVRARVEETIRRLGLVKREEFEAVSELAANARAETEALAARMAALEARMAPASAEPPRRPNELPPEPPPEAPPGAPVVPGPIG